MNNKVAVGKVGRADSRDLPSQEAFVTQWSTTDPSPKHPGVMVRQEQPFNAETPLTCFGAAT